MNDEQALTIMGGQSIDRAKVDDLANRIAEFLPQSKSLPKDTRLAMAQIALAHRLDPFLGDIWAIPERRKVGDEWQITGYRIMIGITAWRRSAHDTEEYWGRRYEKCTDEERKWLGAGPNDLTIKCIVMRRKTGQQPMEFDGFGVFKQGERSQMNPLQCVRLRAERDALKGAFPIGFGGGSVKIGIADDSGNEINGDISHGPQWTEPIASTQDAKIFDSDLPTSDLPATDDSLAHVVKDEPPAPETNPEAPKPANGKPPKLAVLKTPNFPKLVEAVNAKTGHYKTPDHMRAAAVSKLNYAEITDKNLKAVTEALIQYGVEQDALKNAPQ